jgi:hypothetical protein
MKEAACKVVQLKVEVEGCARMEKQRTRCKEDEEPRKKEKRDASRDDGYCYWMKLIIQTMKLRQERLSLKRQRQWKCGATMTNNTLPTTPTPKVALNSPKE